MGVDFAFSNFYLVLFNENEADVENKTLPRKKILTQFTIEDENKLAEIRDVSPKKFNERLLRQ